MSEAESPTPKPPRRKYPEFLGPIVAWFEERNVPPTALELFDAIHRNKWLRPQVEEKLRSLDLSQPMQGELFLRVKRALELFEAIDSGEYPRPKDWSELEPWLQRALAYFVAGADAIPDHYADGFEDDHREFVAMADRLGPVMDHFLAWQAQQRELRGE